MPLLGHYGWATGWGALEPGSRLRPKTLQVPFYTARLARPFSINNFSFKFLKSSSLIVFIFFGERVEYRMLIGKVYREIVKSPRNWMKRSTCTQKEEGDFCRRYFDYGSKFRE